MTTSLPHRPLGASLSVSAVGLGCMSLSGVYGEANDDASVALIHHAIDAGVDHFDSSDMYGWGQNEEVLGRALKGRRGGVVLATKFGQTRRDGQPNGVDGRPEYVAQACEASLRRLGVEVVERDGPDGPETVLHAAEVISAFAPYDLVRQMRASFNVLGPLLAR